MKFGVRTGTGISELGIVQVFSYTKPLIKKDEILRILTGFFFLE